MVPFFPIQLCVCSQLTATQGRVGLRAFQRFQTLSKVPRGLRGHVSKGGFDSKMTRGEAARIVQIKYHPDNEGD